MGSRHRDSETLEPGTKRCTGCREVKPLTEFFHNKRQRDGFALHCKECMKKEHRKYHKKNADKVHARTAKWRKEHPGYSREYARAHPEQCKKYNRRRLHRLQTGRITMEQRLQLYEEANYTCKYCGKQFERKHLTLDHVIPVSRGGLNHVSNVVVACRSCNSSKYRKVLK